MLRSSRSKVLRKGVLKNFEKIHRKTPVPESYFLLKKETLAQVFSSEFWKISKNVFSYRTPPVAASVCCLLLFRSSHQRCSVRKGVLRNFTKFTGKHLRRSPFFNKVAGTNPVALLKKRLWHRCFPVKKIR